MPIELFVPNTQLFRNETLLSVTRLLWLFFPAISLKLRITCFPKGGLLFVEVLVLMLDVRFLKFFCDDKDENTVSIGEISISPTLTSCRDTNSVTF